MSIFVISLIGGACVVVAGVIAQTSVLWLLIGVCLWLWVGLWGLGSAP